MWWVMLTLIEVCLRLAQPHPSQKNQDVLVKCLCKDRIKERVCTRVERVKKHQQYLWRKTEISLEFIKKKSGLKLKKKSHLGICDSQQWLVESCRQAIEANGCQTHKVGQNENSHAFGHAGVTSAGLVLGIMHHTVDV